MGWVRGICIEKDSSKQKGKKCLCHRITGVFVDNPGVSFINMAYAQNGVEMCVRHFTSFRLSSIINILDWRMCTAVSKF